MSVQCVPNAKIMIHSIYLSPTLPHLLLDNHNLYPNILKYLTKFGHSIRRKKRYIELNK